MFTSFLKNCFAALSPRKEQETKTDQLIESFNKTKDMHKTYNGRSMSVHLEYGKHLTANGHIQNKLSLWGESEDGLYHKPHLISSYDMGTDWTSFDSRVFKIASQLFEKSTKVTEKTTEVFACAAEALLSTTENCVRTATYSDGMNRPEPRIKITPELADHFEAGEKAAEEIIYGEALKTAYGYASYCCRDMNYD